MKPTRLQHVWKSGWAGRHDRTLRAAALVILAGAGWTHAAEPTAGADLYQSHCAVCHGDRGGRALWGSTSLDPPPAAFSQLDPETELPRTRMIASVTYGRPGTSMVSFADQLSTAEIAAVVDYIRRAFMVKEAHARPPEPSTRQPTTNVGIAVLHGDDQVPSTLRAADPVTLELDAPLPGSLVGDPARGGTLFAESCTACHGPGGDGRGPRAYFIYPRPLSFIDTANRERLNRPSLFDSIKHGVRGREMPAWGKVLTDQEIADVVEYVFQAFVIPVQPSWQR